MDWPELKANIPLDASFFSIALAKLSMKDIVIAPGSILNGPVQDESGKPVCPESGC